MEREAPGRCAHTPIRPLCPGTVGTVRARAPPSLASALEIRLPRAPLRQSRGRGRLVAHRVPESDPLPFDESSWQLPLRLRSTPGGRVHHPLRPIPTHQKSIEKGLVHLIDLGPRDRWRFILPSGDRPSGPNPKTILQLATCTVIRTAADERPKTTKFSIWAVLRPRSADVRSADCAGRF